MSALETSRKNVRARTWQRFLHHRLAFGSLWVLVLLVLLSVSAPLVEKWLAIDAFTADLHQRLQGPSFMHPLGTDEIGRDYLARLLYPRGR